MTFTQNPTAIIWAKTTEGEFLSIDGVTAASTTPENAAAQINKILDAVGLSIVTDGMQRFTTEEAI